MVRPESVKVLSQRRTGGAQGTGPAATRSRPADPDPRLDRRSSPPQEPATARKRAPHSPPDRQGQTSRDCRAATQKRAQASKTTDLPHWPERVEIPACPAADPSELRCIVGLVRDFCNFRLHIRASLPLPPSSCSFHSRYAKTVTRF